MALDTNIHVKVAATQYQAAGLATSTAAAVLEKSLTWATGTGLSQADRMYQKSAATIGPSATTSLDFAAGVVDDFGASITMARLKLVVLFAYAANANDLHIVRPASNGVPWFIAVSNGILVRPGGIFLWAAPDAIGVVVTPTSGDLISLTNPAASTITYDVIVLGASA
jgi:hypothetical protein